MGEASDCEGGERKVVGPGSSPGCGKECPMQEMSLVPCGQRDARVGQYLFITLELGGIAHL